MRLTKEQSNFIKDNHEALDSLMLARVNELKDLACDLNYPIEERDLFARMASEYKNFWISEIKRLVEKYDPTTKEKIREKRERNLRKRI